MEAGPLLEREVCKIVPAGKRPFASFYYPSYPVDTGLKPEHVEKCSPCEASCPAGIPTGRFLRLLRLGETEKAVRLLDEYTTRRSPGPVFPWRAWSTICKKLQASG